MNRKKQLLPRFAPLAGAAAALAFLLAGLAGASAQTAPALTRRVVSTGARPFTDTWRAMRARTIRELALEGAGFPVLPRLRRPPNPDRPAQPGTTENPLQRAFLAPRRTAPANVGTTFPGTTNQKELDDFRRSAFPPDTQGAIGPSHFVEIVNSSVTIYTRSGAKVTFGSDPSGRVFVDDFFRLTVGGATFPRAGSFDTRIVYDRRSGHWFASCLEFGSATPSDNDAILAVSRTSDPTGTWDKYVIPVGEPTAGGVSTFTDYDTLGVDDNGVYIPVVMAPSSGSFTVKVAATPKAPLIAASPSIGAVTTFSGISDVNGNLQPALRLDAAAPTDPAWFAGSSRFLTGPSAGLVVRTLTWSGSVPTLSGASQLIPLENIGNPVPAPSSGATTPIDTVSIRAQCTVVRNNQLWTARNVGLNSAGSANNSATDVDRTGVEWVQLGLSGTTATRLQNGRVFDNALANPRFFFYPGITVNGAGQAVMGFSGCRSDEFASCYVCTRLSSDPLGTMGAVSLLKAGEGPYTRTDRSGRNRWGDYSFSSVDPLDDQSIWTIQEFTAAPKAGSSANDNWATFIAKVLAPPPTLDNPSASGSAGASGVTLPLTGTGFFDPGAGFSRPSVTISGAGVTVTNVTVNSSTSITATLSISPDAALGSRSITITNPDGQTAAVANGFTVAPPSGGTVQFSSAAYSAAEGGTATITVTRTGDLSTTASVSFAASAGTATAGDFTAAGGTLNFTAGDPSSKTFTVPTAVDNLLEGDETVNLTLSGASGTTITGGSATLTITDDASRATPTGVSASAGSAHQVTVSWTDNSGNETGFVIERSGGGSTVTFAAAANTAGFSDTSTAGSTSYAYRVKAVNGSLQSPFSTDANVTTPAGPPLAPTNVTAAFVSLSQVTVGWQQPSSDAASFRIERRTASTSFAQVAAAAAGATSASDTTGLTPNTGYFYRVVAINAAGEAASAEVSLNAPGGGRAKIKPPALKFAKTFVGRTGKPKAVTIQNVDKKVPLFVTVGAATGPFTVTSGQGSTTLAPKQKLKVTVTYTPAAVGLESGALLITTGDPLHPSVTVNLTGSGKAPKTSR